MAVAQPGQSEIESRSAALQAAPAPQAERNHAPATERAADAPVSDVDALLMVATASGDAHAASSLCRRNLDRVSRYVGRVVRDPGVVEDLVQDVFVQVLAHARQYSPTARFSTWLYRVATNVALDHLRADNRRRKVSLDAAPPPVAPQTDTHPERAVNLDELRRRLSAAMDELPPNQRAALTLFEYEGFSYQQIATVLGASEDSVRALLLRARNALRARLNGAV